MLGFFYEGQNLVWRSLP